MPYTSIFKITILLLLSAWAPLSHAQLAKLPAKLVASFEQQDTSIIATELATNFSVAGHTGAGAGFRLEQIIRNHPVKAVHMLSEKKTRKGTLVELAVTDSANNKTSYHALIDGQGKIVHFSLFDELYGLKRESEPKLRAIIPFENKNGSIFLQVKINDYDRPLRLLFDTGADGMAISEELADLIGLVVTRENDASVVGGTTTIQVSDNNTIGLDTLKLTNQGIAIFPEMATDADGIIGNQLIGQYITHIDYDNNTISLYDFGNFEYKSNGIAVPITKPASVVVLPGQLEIVAGKQYLGHFAFDTGAAYHLICFRPFVRENKLLVSGFRPEARTATMSFGVSSPTFLGKSYQFAIPQLPTMKGLPITLMGGSGQNEQWRPAVDGSIGVRLLSRYNLTINLADGEIHFSPNKLHKLPQDFLLKNYQLGWDNAGQLKILRHLYEENLAGLNDGALILRIDAYTTDQLQKQPALIDEIRTKALAGPISITLTDNTVVKIE